MTGAAERARARRAPDLQRARAQDARPLVLGHVRRGDAILHGHRLALLPVFRPIDVDDAVRLARGVALLALLATLLALTIAHHVHVVLVKVPASRKKRRQ